MTPDAEASQVLSVGSPVQHPFVAGCSLGGGAAGEEFLGSWGTLNWGQQHLGLHFVSELRGLAAALCLFGPKMPPQPLPKEDLLSHNNMQVRFFINSE